jgi:polyisoprenoid-binding protein YceI
LRSVTFAVVTLMLGLVGSDDARGRDYQFDTVHSQVGFEVSHLGFSMSQGRFKGISGGFSFHPRQWQRSGCDVRIDVRSLDMGDAAWRDRLLGRNWLDAAAHPEMRFVCTRLEQTDARRGRLHGNLSLHGATREVVLDLVFNRAGMHKYALRHVAGFSATARLRRSDFGIVDSLPDVGDEVIIRIEIEGNLRKTP